MRSASLALALGLVSSAACAEVWVTREGECGEWAARWNVEQERDGVWVGTIDHWHGGGPCVQGTNNRARSNVHAVLIGDEFFATRQTGPAVCSYYGKLREDRVRGFLLCEGTPKRLMFALRFPPAGDRDLRQRPQDAPDDFLDDPGTYRRGEPPAGFELELRTRPR